VGLCLLTYCSCASKSPLEHVGKQEFQTLSRIEQLSGWSFEVSRAAVEVRGPGAIELIVDGDVSRHSESDDPLWLPIALMATVPEYIRVESNGGAHIDMETYGVAGRLWCITAVVKDPSVLFAERPSTERNRKDSRPISLRFLLYSKSLEAALPMLIPISRANRQVDVSVELPHGGRFSGTTVTAADETGTSSFNLAVLPKATPNEVSTTAAANTRPSSMTLWNLSNVRFTSEAPPIWKPWFMPSAALILLLSLAAWARFSSPSPSALHRILTRAEHALNRVIEANDFGEQSGERRQELRFYVVHLLSKINDFRLTGRNETYSVALQLSRLLDGLRYQMPHDASSRWSAAYHISSDLSGLLRAYHREPAMIRLLRQTRRWVFPVAGMLTVFALIWLLATLAKAQLLAGSSPPQQRSESALYDMVISVTPNDPNSDSHNRVSVGLTFYGASDRPGFGVPQAVDINHDFYDRFEIQEATTKPNTVTTAQSRATLRAQVPRSYAPEVRRFRGMAELGLANREFHKTGDYQDTVGSATLTEIHYQLNGAERSRAYTGWSWLHRFPFDQFDVRFPVRFSEPVMLSKIDIMRIPGEFYANPKISGLSWEFSSADDGTVYRAVGRAGDIRWAIMPHEIVSVEATFRRGNFQRFGLTVGLTIIAILVGGLLGGLTTLPDKSWQGQLIAAVGILTLPFAVRTAVFGTYKGLPNILLGQGVTIFDLVFLLAVALLCASCWTVRRSMS
jgi:hypothetical protein